MDVIVFGTGKYFENYMINHSLKNRPLFAVDNCKEKVTKSLFGVEVKSPEVLKNMPKDSFYVIICCNNSLEIEEQLISYGIYNFQKYYPVDLTKEENFLAEKTISRHKIGYSPGAFDLFHMGHLDFLRKSKERCEFLIVGVLTDELFEYFKNRKPVIPFNQRIMIVESVVYADRVVPVDFSNTVKIDAWKKYNFNCHFSGSDHINDWNEDKKQLEEVGSKMEFFSYSQANSSTEIRNKTNY